MSDVKVRIDADGGQAFQVLQKFRAALKEAGQQGREFSKIDFSQPSLARLADDMKAVNAEYEMLLRSSQSLRTHVKQTGQSGVAPWDLDVSKWHTTTSGAQRQREELARRLLRNTSAGAGLPPGGGGGGGGIPSIPGLGIPGGLGGILKFTLGMAGLGSIAGMVKQGVGQAQQEAITLDPLWRRLQSTAGAFDELREKTRSLGNGLGVTFEESIKLGKSFSSMAAEADTNIMLRGTRAGIGMARGLGMDPAEGVAFMGRSRFKGLFDGTGERRFASLIATGVKEGGMQAAPEKVLQAVDQLTDSLVRSGVSAGGQVPYMLDAISRMNASKNPALRGEYGSNILGQMSSGIANPGGGEAGEFFMYRALNGKDPYEYKLRAEKGAFFVNEDGETNLEKVLKQARQDYANPAQRADAMHNATGLPRNAYAELDKLFEDARINGMKPTQAGIDAIINKYGGNQGADTLTKMTAIHDALTKEGQPLLKVLNGVRDAVVFAAGDTYKKHLAAPSDNMTDEEFKAASAAKQVEITKAEDAKRKMSKAWMLPSAVKQATEGTGVNAQLLYRIIQAESGGNPNAVSKSGAQGVMQLMPGTARDMGVRDPFNVDQNVMGGAKYFKQMYERYNGDLYKALLAYHSGPGNVDKYYAGKPSNIGPESLAYPQKIMHDLHLQVVVKDPTGKTTGRTTHEMPLTTPQSSGTAAVAVP